MAEQSENQKPKKKFPLATILIVAAILVMEVGTVAAAVWFLGGPSEAQADDSALAEAADAEKPVEMLVLEDKFQNTRSGRSYLYDTEIYIVAKKKYREELKKKIENSKAQITTDVATIFRRAEPAQLHEFELATITRQVESVLNKHLGYTADGESYVQEALVQTMEFRGDL